MGRTNMRMSRQRRDERGKLDDSVSPGNGKLTGEKLFQQTDELYDIIVNMVQDLASALVGVRDSSGDLKEQKEWANKYMAVKSHIMSFAWQYILMETELSRRMSMEELERKYRFLRPGFEKAYNARIAELYGANTDGGGAA